MMHRLDICSRQEFRAWLCQHHLDEAECWVR